MPIPKPVRTAHPNQHPRRLVTRYWPLLARCCARHSHAGTHRWPCTPAFLLTASFSSGAYRSLYCPKDQAQPADTNIAGLAVLRGIDAEQTHKLRTELHGIAVYDLKAGL